MLIVCVCACTMIRMMEVHERMVAKGNPLNYDIIMLMIRLGQTLEHRYVTIAISSSTWSL